MPYRKKGFTLIELLVVISIIALLLSILMPALSRVKESARRVVCGTNEKSIAMGFMMYASENNDYLVPDRGLRVNPKTRALLPYDSADPQISRPWDSSLAEQWSARGVDTFKKLVACPSDRAPRQSPPIAAWFKGGNSLKRSYAPNASLYNNLWTPWTPKELRGNSTGIPTKSAKVSQPSRVILLAEIHKGTNWNGTGVEYGNVQGTNYYDVFIIRFGPEVPWATMGTDGRPVVEKEWNTVHEAGANFAFCDGSVQWSGAVAGQDYVTGQPFKNIRWASSWKWKK